MKNPTASGVFFGLSAALAWAFYNIGASTGRANGFSSFDLTLLRFLGGGVTMAPLLLMLPARGKQASRLQLLALVLTAGPIFALLVKTGFGFAPLSHAIVISPGLTLVVATMFSRFVDGAELSAMRILGMGVVLLGLIVIALDQNAGGGDSGQVWLGDLCFVCSGTLWGVFTWLMGRWQLDPVRVTGQIAISSAIVFLPVYFAVTELPTIRASAWLAQFVYQGVLGGALAVVFYAASVNQLGTQRAGLFPALVPPTAVIIAIPITGDVPNLQEVTGIVFASVGLILGLGVLKFRLRR